jgi:hypothetical protein
MNIRTIATTVGKPLNSPPQPSRFLLYFCVFFITRKNGLPPITRLADKFWFERSGSTLAVKSAYRLVVVVVVSIQVD